MKKNCFSNKILFKRCLKPLSWVFLSNLMVLPVFSADRTANITSGSQQLTGAYELNLSSQNQAVVKITGANTVVAGNEDVSVSVNGAGNAISLTNGALTLTGASIQATNNSNNNSYMILNTNGNLNVYNSNLSTETLKASGISANGANATTFIDNSYLKGGYNTIEGINGATIDVKNSQIDNIGNYGIVLSNNANVTGTNNRISMNGSVYSQSAVYAASNAINTTSSATLNNTQIYVKDGISGIHADIGGKINMTGIDVTGNINTAIRATKTGNIDVKNGTITLDMGAIAVAQGTSDQSIADIKLTNIIAESNGNQNHYENNKNYALINAKEFSKITIEGGSYHSKGTEQHGVWAMNDSAFITLNNTAISTDTDKSIAIKSNGNVNVTNTTISTAGNLANALYSEAAITAKRVNITTTGNNASAVSTSKTGQIDINDSTIQTSGSNASVLEATNNSTIMAKNITATTTGDSSHAILASRTGYYDSQNYITVSDSTINTSGNNAAGIAAINKFNSTQADRYKSDITLNNTSITSDNSYGLYVKGMDAKINLTNGSSLIANNGHLIYAESYNFGTNNILANVNLIAGNNSRLVGNVDFQEGSSVEMQLTGAHWKMLSSSKVTNLSNLNNSVIDLINSNGQYNTLSITGNYTGDSNKDQTNNGRLIVNTLWNDNGSTSDVLNITGTATGYTRVQTNNGIIGDVTQDDDSGKYSTDVIKVGSHSLGSNSFYGFADTAGAGQALLVQKDDNTYAWYIPKLSPTPPPAPPPVSPTPIKPEVPGFTVMPDANMGLGYRLLGTLHQRISEQQTMMLDNCSSCQSGQSEGQIWGRFLGSYTDNKGENRLGYRSKMWGAQLGYDFAINHNPDNGSRTHSGVTLTYAKDDLQFHDKQHVTFNQSIGQYQTTNQKTGSGQTDWVGLGGYYTYYNKKGGYLDLVGNLNYAHNKYDSIRSDKTSNNAYGTTLSAEVGQPFKILHSQWLIEPQAQLIYQYLHFSNFNTLHDIKVDQNDRHGLRGRLGFRLGYNEDNQVLKTNAIYFTGNIYHDFINGTNATKIGNSRIKEKFANTWGEIGVGVQLPVSKSSSIYADVRYDHSLNNHRGTREGYQGNVGFKYHW